MYNNALLSSVIGQRDNHLHIFRSQSATVRMQPAINAWTGATVNHIQPDPGNDGIGFIGYKVTNPSPGVWHYE